MQSQRSLEWIADHIVEVEAGKTLAFRKPVGMDDDESSPRDEAIWLARDIFRDAVIHDLLGFNADIDWNRVVALQGWGMTT